MASAASPIPPHQREILHLSELERCIERRDDLRQTVIKGLDLRGHDLTLEGVDLEGAVFLGCRFRDREQEHAIENLGGYVFPRFKGLPYDPWRRALYTVDELMRGYDEGGYTTTCDFAIYSHFDRARRLDLGVPMMETLAQRIHDHAIDAALSTYLESCEARSRGLVGVMGGHGTRRDDPYYREVAKLTWSLTRQGYMITSGGGPGIMEAANLGAYLSHFAEIAVVDEAIAQLSEAPKFDGGHQEGSPAYLEAIRTFVRVSREVVARFGPEASDEVAARFKRERRAPGESLAVPTWFYGHEPSNLFSSHIAKYFANSIREDGLLAISHAGVVYAPGSAGTLQEVFMDLAQNHYATFTWRSPMVFLGRDLYAPIVKLLEGFVAARGVAEVYGDLIACFDDAEAIVDFIATHPPRRRQASVPLYELLEAADQGGGPS